MSQPFSIDFRVLKYRPGSDSLFQPQCLTQTWLIIALNKSPIGNHALKALYVPGAVLGAGMGAMMSKKQIQAVFSIFMCI